MVWVIILAFAVSSSVDNLAVGISYGIRDIQIEVRKNFLVAVVCFLMSITGISFGIWFGTILPGTFPVIIGAFLLFVIGIRIILLAVPRSKAKVADSDGDKKKCSEVKGIPKKSMGAVSDKLGYIGWGEAVFLGVALSANALTNGLGAGLLGYSPLMIAITAAIGSYFSVWAGVKLGHKLAAVRIGKFTVGQFGAILSGLIIILIALISFF